MDYHRRSIRLKGYDYSSNGMYFITICTQDRSCLFGDIHDSKMHLSEAGEIVNKWCIELRNKFRNISLDDYVIMPNHIHGIISIVGADLCVCPDIKTIGPDIKSNKIIEGEHIGSPLHEIVQWFKTMTTNEYMRHVKAGILSPFNKRLWQRNYWEHIIRSEEEYNKITYYIDDNIENWEQDKLRAALDSSTDKSRS